MKNIMDQVKKGQLEIKVEPGNGYIEVQCLLTQMENREEWKSKIIELAEAGSKLLWIDINERRPGNEDCVDICIPDNGEDKMRIPDVVFLDKNNFPHFYEQSSDTIYYLEEVTHWMHPVALPK